MSHIHFDNNLYVILDKQCLQNKKNVGTEFILLLFKCYFVPTYICATNFELSINGL